MSRASKNRNSLREEDKMGEAVKSNKIKMRNCNSFIQKDQFSLKICGCGKQAEKHSKEMNKKEGEPGTWNIMKHTSSTRTDTFGTMEFQSGIDSRHVRVAFDTEPGDIMDILLSQWNIPPPKLVISITGSISNFSVEEKVSELFHSALLNTVKASEAAWILTPGLNSGIVRHVSSAFAKVSERRRAKNLVLIGIAPWGMIRNKEEIRGRRKRIPWNFSTSSLNAQFSVLNQRHNYFLLADNGTTGRYGAEMILRRRLESYLISTHHPGTDRNVPVVSVCLDGGFYTVCNLWSSIRSAPVILCGRDRLPSLIRAAIEGLNPDNHQKEFPAQVIAELQTILERQFGIGKSREAIWRDILSGFAKNKEFVIFSQNLENFEHQLLRAMLRQTGLSQEDELLRTIEWNRADMAETEVFVHGRNFESKKFLERAMINALKKDKVNFVPVLLSAGIHMDTFLTHKVLEELYRSDCHPGASNTLCYVADDVWKKKSREDNLDLLVVGKIMDSLMGPGFISQYSKREFKVKYLQHKNMMTKRTEALSMESKGGRSRLKTSGEEFEAPFDELFIWAVITNKSLETVNFFLSHGGDILAKELIAMKLYTALAKDALEDDVVHDMEPEFTRKANYFREKTGELLEVCWGTSHCKTMELLSYELGKWGQETCISLAARANHQSFFAHSSVQTILLDLWKGGLNMRRHTNFYVIAGCLCPLLVYFLKFKSREELQVQPQIALEHEASAVSAEKSDSMEGGSWAGKEEVGVEMESLSSGEDTLDSRKPHPAKKAPKLSCGMKYYEFFNAPITIFWYNVVSHVVFLGFFIYMVLVETPEVPSPSEIVVILYIFSIGLDLMRKFFMAPSDSLRSKWKLFAVNRWNVACSIAVLIFLVAFSLRMYPTSWSTSFHHPKAYGRILYSVSAGFWCIRSYAFLAVHPQLGVHLNIFGKMSTLCVHLIALCMVNVMGFGVIRQSILHPKHKEWDWILLRNVFYKPYFMLYGEVYAAEIDVCGDDVNEPGLPQCVPGVPIVVLFMVVFLILANIVLIGSLLIAVFSNVYSKIEPQASELWKFQRYANVVEYSSMPVFPPPFIVIGDIWQTSKFVYSVMRGRRPQDYALKLFLDEDTVDTIHSFEEESYEEQASRTSTPQDTSTNLILERLVKLENKLDEISELAFRDIQEKMRQMERRLKGRLEGCSVMDTEMTRGFTAGGRNFVDVLEDTQLEDVVFHPAKNQGS